MRIKNYTKMNITLQQAEQALAAAKTKALELKNKNEYNCGRCRK